MSIANRIQKSETPRGKISSILNCSSSSFEAVRIITDRGGGLAAVGGSAPAPAARWILQTTQLLAHLFCRQRVTRQTFQLERARQHISTMLLHERIVRDEPSKSRRQAQPVQPLQTLSKTSPRCVRVRRPVESVTLPYLPSPSSRQVLVFFLRHVRVHARGYGIKHLSACDAQLGIMCPCVDHPWERTGDDADVCDAWVCRGRVPSFYPGSLGFGRPIAVAGLEEHVPPEMIILRVGRRREKWVEFNDSSDDLCQEWLQNGSICTTDRTR